MAYSAIIKNGIIIDGTKKNRNFKADIGIKNEKIDKIGDLKNQKAEIEIDANDMYVAPGLIDITTHSDTHWTLLSQPTQETFIRQGVTTIIGGHGGASLAPLINKESIRVLEKWVDPSSTNINWQTTSEFYKQFEAKNIGVNFGSFTGYENIKRNVCGNEIRPADKKEIREMANILSESLKQGSFGLSTNLGTAYSSTASNEELIELFKVCKKHKAISSHHLENEGKNILPSISRMIMLLRNSESRGNISHFKALGRKAWEDFENALNMIELAQKDGIELTCDFFPYTRTGSSLTSFLPPWLMSETKEKIIEMLGDEKIRKDVTEYLESLTLHYEKITIAFTLKDTGSTGKSIKQLARDAGIPEEQIVIDLLKINNLQVSIFSDVIMPEHLEMLSQKPYAMVASDGVGYDLSQIKNSKDFAHPRSLGTFVKFLKEFVKEKTLLSWENAIYKMSGMPAKLLGIEKRGAVVEKNIADLMIFNPQKLSDKSTYDNPWQYPDGIENVFINGQPVLINGEIKNTAAGQIIKKS